MAESKRRIIIIGGGFAGVKCAETLCRELPLDRFEVVMFDRENHMVFSPLLAEVVGGSLEPDSIAAPLRWMLPKARVRTETVAEIEPDAAEVVYEKPDGGLGRMRYDHLVIACGAEVNLGLAPGMADHGMAMKTVADAMFLRSHVMNQLELADSTEDPAMRAWRLSFVIVGAGFSGVEAAGEINDLARSISRYYPNIRREEITVTVIHSRGEILPEVPPALRDFARRQMEKRGITFRLNARADLATAVGVGLSDGSLVRGATILCAVGTRISPVIERLPAKKVLSRLVTQPDMRLDGRENIWAIGDAALVVNARDGKPAPATGQFAEREGRQAARNIARAIRGEPTLPFSFRPLGQLCSIGGRKAVAEIFGRRVSGFWAWFLWRGVYLFKLPTWSRRVKVGFDWAWELFFRRDLVFIRPTMTEPVSHAFFRPGDYVYRAGEPATNFYMIESGEAEILGPPDERGREPEVTRLGPGNFFGERALLSDLKTRKRSVRARTALQVIVMGRRAFDQLSSALAPLKELLAESIERRSRDLWQILPDARGTLERAAMSDLVSPAPGPTLRPDASLREAAKTFHESGADFLLVADDQNRLGGLVTRTALLWALDSTTNGKTCVRDFMIREPITVTMRDSPALAATLMRDHGVKTLPVLDDAAGRHVTGVVRASSLLSRAIESGNGGGDGRDGRGRAPAPHEPSPRI